MSVKKYIATVTTTCDGEMFIGVFDQDDIAKHAAVSFVKNVLMKWEPAFGFNETWNMHWGNTKAHVSPVTQFSGNEYTG